MNEYLTVSDINSSEKKNKDKMNLSNIKKEIYIIQSKISACNMYSKQLIKLLKLFISDEQMKRELNQAEADLEKANAAAETASAAAETAASIAKTAAEKVAAIKKEIADRKENRNATDASR